MSPFHSLLTVAVERVKQSSSESQNNSLWIIVGVAVPVAVVLLIIIILYWKLCRTDKLEFQPDTMSNIQQRQKVKAWWENMWVEGYSNCSKMWQSNKQVGPDPVPSVRLSVLLYLSPWKTINMSILCDLTIKLSHRDCLQI